MELIYQTHPVVNLATNVFVNTPVVLQFEHTPLISIVSEQDLGFTTEIPIYHPDGTKLAKINGTRVYPTEAGSKAGISMRSLPDMTVCELAGKTLFEIQHQKGDAFRMMAELYTNTGYFIKLADAPVSVMQRNGEALRLGGVTMTRCTISNCPIGVLITRDGGISMGVMKGPERIGPVA